MGTRPSTLRGDIAPQLQQEVYDWDPARGYVFRAKYKGASQAQMLALQNGYINLGIASRLTFNQGDTAEIEADDSTQSYLIDTWQILGNEESRDGLSHPALISALLAASVVPENVIASARQHIENNDDPVALFAVGGDFYGSPAALKRFYNLQVRGSTEYRHAQYVLRHTTNAPCRWRTNIADVGIDKIYTTSELLTETQDAGLWVYPMPGRLAYKISAIPAPASQAAYLWGWLKGGSTETTSSNNRIDITTEYVLEQWSTDYYLPY